MKKQLDFLVQYEVEFQGWQSRSSEKFTICYLVFLRKCRRWAFFKNTLQALDPPTFRIFRFNFGYGNDFQQQFLLKNSEISTLLGSSPVLRHNNACVRDVLTAPSNVYLNLGLNLFHSYF